MDELIRSLFEFKDIAILGFGREGKSTYNLLRRIFPAKIFTIVDENDAVRDNETIKEDTFLRFITGKNCMHSIDGFDVAFKSPGIPSNTLPAELKRVHLTSQTDIFLQCYGAQSIGITGTKGKSTTSSLIFNILKNAGLNTMLVGNIGIPPFDCINDIRPDSFIVLELSSHQLEYVANAPHIAVLLNLYQEHLDHYYTYEEYKSAKFNIGKYQHADDFFIYNADNETLLQLIARSEEPEHKQIDFSLEPGTRATLRIEDQYIVLQSAKGAVKLYDTRPGQPLKGHHNLYNIMAAAVACYLCGVTTEQIGSGIRSFNGLAHRIESVGEYGGISWYNDSIATIPEATIEAVRTLQTVDTLILGGFDRGIEYTILYPFLPTSGITNLIFVGDAGKRMMKEFISHGKGSVNLYTASDYSEVVNIAGDVTQKGRICLLSPAAASYDMFKNFEERGDIYKKNVKELNPSHP